VPILTVGHGTLPGDDFVALLRDAGVERLVDVRSYPGSRHNPQFNREALAASTAGVGIQYEWMRDLGGRRHPRPSSRHRALRNDAFRGYADHMETDEFHRGIEELVGDAAVDHTVVMCSESVWWRCHRRLIADHLVLVRGIDVVHLMHDGRQTAHAVTDGARRESEDVVYDVGTTPALDLPAR
jgi:uncharacterized protein (DUF488 family)